MTSYAFKVRPLEGGFVSRDLTTSSRNRISGVLGRIIPDISLTPRTVRPVTVL